MSNVSQETRDFKTKGAENNDFSAAEPAPQKRLGAGETWITLTFWDGRTLRYWGDPEEQIDWDDFEEGPEEDELDEIPGPPPDDDWPDKDEIGPEEPPATLAGDGRPRRTGGNQEKQNMAAEEAKSSPSGASKAIRASDVTPRDVVWFWKPYLPRGMLSLLDGDPGSGKSYLTLALAAALSTGRPFPGTIGRPRDPRASLICNLEDEVDTTIVPRLKSLGADLSYIHILNSRALPSLDRVGKKILRDAVSEVRPHFVTIDTIIPFLPAGVATQQATEIRPTLRWLADQASEFETCVLVLRHLRKAQGDNPLHAGQGSMDFVGTCRSSWLAAKDPADPSSYVLAHNKANLARKGQSWRYGWDEQDRFEWRGPSSLTADDLVRVRKGRGPTAVKAEEALTWLETELMKGPRPANELYEAADRAGISERTLERAKSDLGVVSKRAGKSWVWGLPEVAAERNPGQVRQESQVSK
jgi:hypothetical protein